jgi:hypothetical protein
MIRTHVVGKRGRLRVTAIEKVVVVDALVMLFVYDDDI